MRQIKFRGKDKYTNKWVFGDLAHSKGISSDGLYDRVMVGGYHVIEESVGQFTGLLDKNGKEIYEGDILLDRYKDSDEEIVDYYSEVGTRRACFGYITGNKEFLPFFQYDMIEVVVGNIHDNPELLKGGKE